MYCPFCGARIRNGSSFCSVCDRDLPMQRINKKRISILHVLLILIIVFSAGVVFFAYSLVLYYHRDSCDISADGFLIKEIIKASDIENQYNDTFLVAEENGLVIFFPEKGDIESYSYIESDNSDDSATVLDPTSSYITIHTERNYAYVDVTASDYSIRYPYRKATLKERLRFMSLYPTFTEAISLFFK